jgi:predicted nucleic acid-binding protein
VKLLVDTNVVLDAALARQPWVKEAARLVHEIESATVAAYVAGHTVTTVYYVLRKHLGSQKAMLAISNMLRLFEVVPVEKADFFQASSLGIPDYEDAVQAVCAAKIGADYIVTRNEKDFAASPVPAWEPAKVLALL